MMSKSVKSEPGNDQEPHLKFESAKTDNYVDRISREKLQHEASVNLSSPRINEPFIDRFGESTLEDHLDAARPHKLHGASNNEADSQKFKPEMKQIGKINSETHSGEEALPLEQIVRDKNGIVTRATLPSEQTTR